jgi:opacity protein-like surface antigen
VLWAGAIVFEAAFALAATSGNGSENLTSAESTPLPSEPFNWTGLYIGFNVGALWEHADLGRYDSAVDLDEQFDRVDPNDNFAQDIPFNLQFMVPSRSRTDTTPIAGGQIGFLQQFGHIVVGAEGGLSGMRTTQWTKFEGFQSGSTGIDSITFETSFASRRWVEAYWNGYLGGEFGFAWGRFLVYGTAGAAFTNVDIRSSERASTNFFAPTPTPTSTPTPTPSGPIKQPAGSVLIGSVTSRANRHDSDVQVGWYAGGGVQYALTNSISAGFEYRHSNFGDNTYAFGSPVPLFPGATNIGLDSDQFTFRLNVLLGHFGH